MTPNKRKARLARAIAATALSLALVASLQPAPALADDENASSSASSPAADAKFESLIEPGAPQGFSEDLANPYGTPIGEKFLLSEQNELLLYYAFDTDKNRKNQHSAWFDTFNPGSSPDLTKSDTGFDSQGTYENTQAYSYVQAVGFDPQGTGRKDHVAYVGYERTGASNDKGYYVLWVMDTVNGTQSEPYRLRSAEGASCDWLENHNADLYAGSNFFNIAAGDFDGHGGDDLVVGIVDDKNYGISQIRYESNGSFREISRDDKGLLHPRYNEYASANPTWGNVAKNKLSCDMAVGDFNGDGIDDLAVLSYPNKGHEINRTKNMASVEFGEPYLAVSYGASDRGVVAAAAAAGTYVGTPIENGGGDARTTMFCASLAAGDIEGDGKDELICAGYMGLSYLDGGKGAYMPNTLGGAPLELLYSSFQATGAELSPIEYRELANNAWTRNDSGCTDDVGPKLAVECVAADGKGNPERVFISGDVYRCSPGTNKLFTEANAPGLSPITLDYFKKSDGDAGRKQTGKSYLASVAVGNFSGDANDYEQIAYVVGLQSSDGDHDYSFSVHIATGTGREDGVATGFQLDCGSYIFTNQQFGLDKRTGCAIAAIDRDDDGIVASYMGAGYSWSDPQVRAILQASPYFSELNDAAHGAEYLYDSPETTYSTTTTYSYETSKSNSVSFGVGFAGEASGGVVSVNVETGYALDWTETFTKSVETEVTNTFSAGAYDTVVLCRTPVFLYNFDVTYRDEKGAPVNGVYQMAFPQAPVFEQLSTSRYNEFADYYNGVVEAAYQDKGESAGAGALLDKVGSGLFLGQEGNPYGYYLNDASSGLDPAPRQYGNLVKLTTNAGANSIEYSYTHSEGSSVEMAHGFTFDLTIMGGFSVGGVGAKAGGYVSLQYMKGHSTSTANGAGTTIGGTVMGLDGKAMEEDGLDPDSWSFNWRLATWDSNLKDASATSSGKVPVVGYVLSGVKSPAVPVENPSVAFSRDDATGELVFDLTWECGDAAGSGRPETAGYRVYLYDIARGEYLLLDELAGTQNATYRYSAAADGREYYAFMITAYTEATMTAPSLESVPRFATHYLPTSSGAIAKIEKTSTDGLVDTYTIYLADGTTQTFTVTNGNGIAQIALERSDEATRTDTYRITFADGSSTTFTVRNGADGKDGADGADGVDGKDGADGAPGKDGADGRGIERVEKLHSEGLTDVYAIRFTDGTFSTFAVENGAPGKDGAAGRNGADGASGRDGATGAGGAGATEAAGASGRDGTGGASGAAGATGAADANGAAAGESATDAVSPAASAAAAPDAATAETLAAMQAQIDALEKQVDGASFAHAVCYLALILSLVNLAWNIARAVRGRRGPRA